MAYLNEKTTVSSLWYGDLDIKVKDGSIFLQHTRRDADLKSSRLGFELMSESGMIGSDRKYIYGLKSENITLRFSPSGYECLNQHSVTRRCCVMQRCKTSKIFSIRTRSQFYQFDHSFQTISLCLVPGHTCKLQCRLTSIVRTVYRFLDWL